ncbi:CLUMA_CG004991, isoform A [Clunio marinus]|uniref:CLUMA_CG004991, isoform A n=1 Tax=Clunio marinus TaxID=568069 RepID=A0A1J1HTJ2_9DIPT|nr:CLUMA_CG004991, isoform A [Clunio marinus]
MTESMRVYQRVVSEVFISINIIDSSPIACLFKSRCCRKPHDCNINAIKGVVSFKNPQIWVKQSGHCLTDDYQ